MREKKDLVEMVKNKKVHGLPVSTVLGSSFNTFLGSRVVHKSPLNFVLRKTAKNPSGKVLKVE
jgi:hypothetical protein